MRPPHAVVGHTYGTQRCVAAGGAFASDAAPGGVREWGAVLGRGEVGGGGSWRRSRCVSGGAVSNYRTLNHVAVNWNANESAGV